MPYPGILGKTYHVLLACLAGVPLPARLVGDTPTNLPGNDAFLQWGPGNQTTNVITPRPLGAWLVPCPHWSVLVLDLGWTPGIL